MTAVAAAAAAAVGTDQVVVNLLILGVASQKVHFLYLGHGCCKVGIVPANKVRCNCDVDTNSGIPDGPSQDVHATESLEWDDVFEINVLLSDLNKFGFFKICIEWTIHVG